MNRVVIEVELADTGLRRDVDVSLDLPAGALAQELALLLRLDARPGEYSLEAPSLNRLLARDDTLAGAALWSGSVLILRRGTAEAAPAHLTRVPLALAPRSPTGLTGVKTDRR